MIPYLGAMVMLPPKPRVIWKDTLSFFTRRERHSWFALLMAGAIPALIIWVFVLDGRTNIMPTESIVTYVEIWPADRTDAEIIERQRVLALAENERRAMRREGMQDIAQRLGVDYDRDAAAEADRITEENREALARPEDGAEDSVELETDGR